MQAVDVTVSPPQVLPQRLQGDVEPDLVPILEAVGDRLLGRVDPDLDALDLVPLDLLRERGS